jgi:hypothetical protein
MTDNNAHARTILDETCYAVLATADADGTPWATQSGSHTTTSTASIGCPGPDPGTQSLSNSGPTSLSPSSTPTPYPTRGPHSTQRRRPDSAPTSNSTTACES